MKCFGDSTRLCFETPRPGRIRREPSGRSRSLAHHWLLPHSVAIRGSWPGRRPFSQSLTAITLTTCARSRDSERRLSPPFTPSMYKYKEEYNYNMEHDEWAWDEEFRGSWGAPRASISVSSLSVLLCTLISVCLIDTLILIVVLVPRTVFL